MRFNRRFNRFETGSVHFYRTTFGDGLVGGAPVKGYLKCKLVHGEGKSIIVPDVLFLGESGDKWIQPLAFMPCLLLKTEDDVFGTVWIDIAGGATVRVNFRSSGLVGSFADGGQLFRCAILGPADVESYATGDAYGVSSGCPMLKLFHHANEEAISGIKYDSSFRPSTWNIQGNKTLANVGYAYLTSLDRIKCDEDLKRIAMASDRKIHLQVDGFTPPVLLFPGWEETYKNQILTLEVYRQSTQERQFTLPLAVEAAAVSPAHLFFHKPATGIPFYEVCHPFIFRVGVQAGERIPFAQGEVRLPPLKAKFFDYVVVGDAQTTKGLAAPYDEEETDQMGLDPILSEG
ncbi:hypothetical protein [Corallococcus exiguus]|uniref:hypothetical protein n=1 Tax=Corallococcus exiguus TaxID=83462 RepID=UPI003DA2E2D2